MQETCQALERELSLPSRSRRSLSWPLLVQRFRKFSSLLLPWVFSPIFLGTRNPFWAPAKGADRPWNESCSLKTATGMSRALGEDARKVDRNRVGRNGTCWQYWCAGSVSWTMDGD